MNQVLNVVSSFNFKIALRKIDDNKGRISFFSSSFQFCLSVSFLLSDLIMDNFSFTRQSQDEALHRRPPGKWR